MNWATELKIKHLRVMSDRWSSVSLLVITIGWLALMAGIAGVATLPLTCGGSMLLGVGIAAGRRSAWLGAEAHRIQIEAHTTYPRLYRS